jgi:hypothetical protein
VKLPPIPKAIEAPGGPVRIVQVRRAPRMDGVECWGLYDSSRRRISLLRTLPLAHRWKVLFHELVHVAILDAGLDNGLDDRLHEALCDAIATARVREAFG